MSNVQSTATNRAIAAAIRANVPVLLWGPPGVGKTATLTAWGQAWGYHVETIVGSNREPSDFMGFPIEVNGETHYSTLGWAKRLAEAPKGLAFFDEFTTSPPSVQRVMLRIFQERVVGDFKLPDTVALIGAANPPDIAVDGWDLAAPVSNRMMHLEWAFDLESWMQGCVTGFEDSTPPSIDSMLNDGSESHKIRAKASVLAFLRHNPSLALKVPTDSAAGGRGWPSPRSWTNVMSVLGELEIDDDQATSLVVTGLVGEAAAVEFMAWKLSADLYDPFEVLNDHTIVDWTSRPDRIFALTTGLVAIVKSQGDKATWTRAVDALVACAEAERPDLAYPAMRSLLQSVPKGAVVPQSAIEAFKNLFTKTGRWKANA